MVGERIQARRPFTSPILEMVMREHPEPPEAEPVFPKDVLKAGDTEEAVLDDAKQAFRSVENIDVERNITVETSFLTFRRGFGETTEYKILVNIKGTSPEDVNAAVENMVDRGYLFEFVRFQ